MTFIGRESHNGLTTLALAVAVGAVITKATHFHLPSFPYFIGQAHIEGVLCSPGDYIFREDAVEHPDNQNKRDKVEDGSLSKNMDQL